LAQAIPFALGSTKMTMRVFAPDSGIVVRLKAEQLGDNTKSVETDARTTVANAWETLEFNFANQGAGTAPINYTYTFNMLSAFFNYNVAGSVTGEKTYYFDDVVFGANITPPPPTKVDVTFNVDVKNVPMAPGDTVTLNGTFNGWCGACNKMTNVTGTSVWTTTIALDTAKEYEFKYSIGNWVSQENLASTLTCTKTTSGFTNRVITTGIANQNLPTVCWETCGPCAAGGPTKTNVTFQVDMSKYALAPSDTVTLNGSFNNWCGKCTPMTKKQEQMFGQPLYY
jgi:thiol-disulfide isomerase/thioredoxin